MFGMTGTATDFDLDSQAFANGLRETADALLLDVRTSMEFESGHLPGAVNLDVYGADFLDELQKLDRERPTFVYCRSGNRSFTVANAMKKLGFRTVYNLQDGILGWDGPVE